MSKELYHVKVYEVYSLVLPIHAKSESEARDLAAKELKKHELEEDFFGIDYEYTLDRAAWACTKDSD